MTLTAIDLAREPVGPLAGDYSPAGEYHVVAVLNHPRWREPTIHHSMHRHSRGNWQVACAVDGTRVLEATAHQPEAPQPPMLVHHRRHGAAFAVHARMQVIAGAEHERGLVFGYRHCRDCWELTWADGVWRLWRRRHEERSERARAAADLPDHAWAELQVSGDATGTRVTVDGVPCLETTDAVGEGGWGLVANHVTRFADLAVDGLVPPAAPAEPNGVEPRLWKRIAFDGWGSDRNLRWGDCDGDGRPEVVVGTRVDRLGGDNHSCLASLACFDLDGTRRWTLGAPAADPEHPTTSDLCFQIHDLDGTGAARVVYGWDDRLVVADGCDGSTIRSVRLPVLAEHGSFPRLLPDSIAFADLLGHGRPDCVLIKDRYKNLIAYDRDLNELWRHRGRTGHFPHPVDLDGDGRDEILIGYSLLSADGEELWCREDDIFDHADNIAAAPIGPGGAWRILVCASDAGVYLLDADGRTLAHHAIGHGQSSVIARLHPERDDVQILANTYWGAAGVHCLFDGDGALLAEFEPIPYACLLQPANWAPLGDDGVARDLVLLSTHPQAGGLIDGLGARRVMFPDDGHPVLCSDARDLDGDGVDEVLTWDEHELWIYKADVPGRTPANYPRRGPWHDDSNYRTHFGI